MAARATTMYKLVVLGDGGVGKTALTIQLCLNHFVESYDPTIEDSYRKQVQIDSQACMLEVLDTAGQEAYTALQDQWIRDGEGFVLVYCINSRATFNRIANFYKLIQRVKESSSQAAVAGAGSPTFPGSPVSFGGASLASSQSGSTGAGSGAGGALPGPIPIMLVGNKCDRITDREVSTQEGISLARRLGCDFVEASAKTCVNVERAFFDVVRQLRRQRQHVVGRNGSVDQRQHNNYGNGSSSGASHASHAYSAAGKALRRPGELKMASLVNLRGHDRERDQRYSEKKSHRSGRSPRQCVIQ